MTPLAEVSRPKEVDDQKPSPGVRAAAGETHAVACRFMLRRLLLVLGDEAQSSIRQKLPCRPEESWWRLALIDRSTCEAVQQRTPADCSSLLQW